MTSEAPVTDAILATLEGATEPLGPAEIARRGDLSADSVRQILGKLVIHKSVERVGRGQYRLPDRTGGGAPALPDTGGPYSPAPPSPQTAAGGAPQAGERGVTDVPQGARGDRTRIAHVGAANDLVEHVLSRAILVPTVDSSLSSSGDGIVSDRIDVLARTRTGDADAVRRLTMPSDAMAPTIGAGAPLDIVPTQAYLGAAVYVFALDGRPDVGRVVALPGHSYRVSFDNAAYPVYTLIPADADAGGGYRDAESGLPTAFELRAKVVGLYASI